MVLPDGRVESCGNFHGAPVAFACDFLAIATAEVGAIAERRTDRLLDKSRSHGLPPFLAPDAGVDSGMMIAQYTQAAMVAENRRLAAPASVDSLPTSAMQEDHVSMGWGAARKLRASVDNLRRILAVELACGCRALELRAPLEPAAGPRRARDVARDRPGRRSGPLARARARGGRGTDPRRARCSRRSKARSGSCDERPAGGARPARNRAQLPRLEQEAALRMLMNNLDPDVAERPDDLVVYGGTGKAVRTWDAFDAIVRELRELADDETLLVQSGKPVGVFRTHEWSPRVLIANSNLVGEWANWDEFRRLEREGLTMYGQMTAGSWIYIGSQGIVQGTYECFAEIARRRFGGSLAGTITLTAGLGGMGGAQPLAVTMNDGVALCIEVDPERIGRRLETGYLDEQATTSTTRSRAARRRRESDVRSVSGWPGNAAEIVPELLARGFDADVVTDQTSAHDPLVGYIPAGHVARGGRRAPRVRPRRLHPPGAGLGGRALLRDGRIQGARGGGLRLRQQPAPRGRARRLRARLRLPRLRPRLHPAALLRGQGPVPLGGALRRPGRHRGDRPRRDRRVRRRRSTLVRWIKMAGERIAFQGLPARICWLGYGERRRLGLRFNAMVRSGELSAPIVIGRDHLDSGSVASPYRETESMQDGSDAIADWPLLNALVNTASGASWVSIHHGGGVGIGRSIHAGMVCVADGTELAAEKLDRVLTVDPGMGVIRHADAGYERAIEVAAERGVRVPMQRR